jgi:hypothetical protein
MRRVTVCLLCAAGIGVQLQAQTAAAVPISSDLTRIKRVYVSELTGGAGADALRALIISSLDAAKLFVLTDNPERADAVLKGAADDHPFVDTFDSDEGVSTHRSGGAGRGSSTLSKSSVLYGGISVSESESHHDKERKHEAYATVRLCNRDGDVLWSTTQESLGAKFRGASADVAYKIAHQLTLDMERARRGPSPPAASDSRPAGGNQPASH